MNVYESIWTYMKVFGCIWKRMNVYEPIWMYIKVFDGIWM